MNTTACTCTDPFHHDLDCPFPLLSPCDDCGAAPGDLCHFHCPALTVHDDPDAPHYAPFRVGAFSAVVADVSASDDDTTRLELSDVDCPSAPTGMPSTIVSFLVDLPPQVAQPLLARRPRLRVRVTSAVVCRDLRSGQYETELRLDDIELF